MHASCHRYIILTCILDIRTSSQGNRSSANSYFSNVADWQDKVISPPAERRDAEASTVAAVASTMATTANTAAATAHMII